jgi:RNA 3'-terminal phosphate cyclase (ATP)
MISIDGGYGEGGGQILRTALAMSAITRQALHIHNIRGRRPKPGLMAQHLQALEATAAITRARVQGAKLGSLELTFEPGELAGGDYRFDIGTAGAVTLVAQAVVVPLSFAVRASRITISGGTHVPWSPSFHYFAWHWLYLLGRSGFRIRAMLERIGFYPRGGGCISVDVDPIGTLSPLSFTTRGALRRIRGISLVGSLDVSIAERQQRQALRRLAGLCDDIAIELQQFTSYSPGTSLLLLAEFERSQCCYGALGARGKRAERVADEAVDALEAFLESGAAVDQHAADQLIVPLSIVGGTSELHTNRITQHLLTNVDTVRRFLPVDIVVRGDVGSSGWVRIHGHALR